ncbi:Clp protease N-terminal domain-containing protein [Gordonia crocea]|uniref:Clp protease n=1 Tax=Gordonia crocea TaxID=589162 RepID=A0A7I9V0L4_9ACTN|nr:Clp protease N-terminal domain-containing protein [Gordonia crocea]GED98639.1 hypothetical protein nbrc107697_26780 [Gordonia crocea]
MTFPFAIAEAQDLGQPSLGPEHLILGVLCNARDPLVGIFADHGITLDAARDAVRTATGEQDGDEPSSDEDRYSRDRDALKMLGIDLDQVREAVRRNFGDDLTAGWGRRDERRGRGRGRDGECGPRGPHGHRGGPHGRRGPRDAQGFGGRGPRDAQGFGGRGPRRGTPPWADGPWGGEPGPWGEDGPWSGEDGPWGEGPWEYGRGRRGPRGRRPRFAPVTKRTLAHAAQIAADQDSRFLSTGHLVLAALDADTPEVAAILALAPDVEALRVAVVDQLGADAARQP